MTVAIMGLGRGVKMMLFALFKKHRAPQHDRHYKYVLISLMNGRHDSGLLKIYRNDKLSLL